MSAETITFSCTLQAPEPAAVDQDDFVQEYNSLRLGMVVASSRYFLSKLSALSAHSHLSVFRAVLSPTGHRQKSLERPTGDLQVQAVETEH